MQGFVWSCACSYEQSQLLMAGLKSAPKPRYYSWVPKEGVIPSLQKYFSLVFEKYENYLTHSKVGTKILLFCNKSNNQSINTTCSWCFHLPQPALAF